MLLLILWILAAVAGLVACGFGLWELFKSESEARAERKRMDENLGAGSEEA